MRNDYLEFHILNGELNLCRFTIFIKGISLTINSSNGISSVSYTHLIDESEVLTPADDLIHVDKTKFDVPFVCGAKDLGEALSLIHI